MTTPWLAIFRAASGADYSAAIDVNSVNSANSPADAPIGTIGTIGTQPAINDEPGLSLVPEEWTFGLSWMRCRPAARGISDADWKTLLSAGQELMLVWGPRLAVLGWRTEDIFGLHRLAPSARVDVAGLILFLPHRDIIAATPDTVLLRCRSGSNLTYRRALKIGTEVELIWNLE